MLLDLCLCMFLFVCTCAYGLPNGATGVGLHSINNRYVVLPLFKNYSIGDPIVSATFRFRLLFVIYY